VGVVVLFTDGLLHDDEDEESDEEDEESDKRVDK
jgi:hypothetical protein